MHYAVPICRHCSRPKVVGADRAAHCAVQSAERGTDRARYIRALRECAEHAGKRAERAERESASAAAKERARWDAVLRELFRVAHRIVHDPRATTMECDACAGRGSGDHSAQCEAIRAWDELAARFERRG